MLTDKTIDLIILLDKQCGYRMRNNIEGAV